MPEPVINNSMEDELKQDAQLDENEQEETQDESEEETSNEEDTEEEDEGDDEAKVLKDKLSKTAKELHELREWKKRQLKRQKVSKPQTTDDINSVREEVEEIKLKQVNPSLTDEDISEIRKYAKGAGITALEALKNPIFSAGLEQIISQRKAEQAVPKGKKRSISSVDVSTLDLENPEDVKLLRENPELKAKFLERLNSKR